MVELTNQQFQVAKRRGTTRIRGPRAIDAQYDAGRNRVVVTLSTGIELGLAPCDVEGLAEASAEDLRVIEVDGFGLGLHFPQLDVDLSVSELLEGVLGSRHWMAARRVPTAAKVSTSAAPRGQRRARPHPPSAAD